MQVEISRSHAPVSGELHVRYVVRIKALPTDNERAQYEQFGAAPVREAIERFDPEHDGHPYVLEMFTNGYAFNRFNVETALKDEQTLLNALGELPAYWEQAKNFPGTRSDDVPGAFLGFI